MRSFEKEYAKLNSGQKEAVDTIEGPVMVIAGPGTGKTQVLAMRTANILKRTQARPSNILCLTFSTAGSTAMRERLRELIGPDAYGVTVSTVHGFCDGIIRRNAPAFAEFSASKQISDLEKYRLMQSIINDVSSSFALINPKNPYDRIPAILGRISDCKREGKSYEELCRVRDDYASLMEEKSRTGTKAHDKNVLQARKFGEFVDIFKRYQERLLDGGYYDFDDMILVVEKALHEEDLLLASLQERYQYILVDEAQDLNGAQWKVIQRLTTYDVLPHDPNFFLVGDDDQSIYRFQGANMEHLLGFRDRFPKAPVIVLTENYRSTQKILDAAGRLIKHNEERLIGRIPDLKKDLRAHTSETGSEPVLLRPPSDAAEKWLIADLCEARLAAAIQAEDIAVLVQTNGELFPIYDALRARGIPVVLQGKSDLLTHPIVSQALTILRYLESDADDKFLHAIACECFACHPADIARVISAAREKKLRAIDLFLAVETSDLPLSDVASLVKARDILLDLHQKKDSRSVLETVEAVLRESRLADGGNDNQVSPLDPLDLSAIESFFQYVKERCLSHPFLVLEQFMSDLTFYADEAFNRLRLTYQMPHLVSSGIQLLTAHQSKGLEFHTVILSSFREGHWDQRQNSSALSVPEDLLFGWETQQKRFEKHQDERRVAFVAMTRAKRELIFLCPKEFSVGERARPVAPSAFFAEAGPLQENDASLKHPESSSELLLKPVHKPDRELDAYIQEKLESFALSPSALTSFLENPEEFRRVYLLRQPEHFQEKSLRSMGYGSAVHWALKEWATAKREKKDFDLSEFMKSFEWHLSERNILTKRQRDDLLSQAKEDLPKYYNARLEASSPCIYTVEREYTANLDDIRLKGKIDRIDIASPTSGDAIVIDFKTGKPKAPAAIRGGTEAGKVSWTADGANFRQLVFYSLLLGASEPLLNLLAFRLEYIGERGEDPIVREFVVSDQEKDDLRALIRAVSAKIYALDFTKLESVPRR